MIFELLHAPYPDGYGEELLPLQACKDHLRITDDFEDALIRALRDAALEFVEQYCSVRLAPAEGLQWRAEGFPLFPSASLALGVSPVVEITGVTWLDRAGASVAGAPADFRASSTGSVLPSIGGRWPADVGGGVEITFNAGFAAGAAPPSLLHAAKMFLAHLWVHREAVIDSGSNGEVPFGVRQLCAPFRRISI